MSPLQMFYKSKRPKGRARLQNNQGTSIWKRLGVRSAKFLGTEIRTKASPSKSDTENAFLSERHWTQAAGWDPTTTTQILWEWTGSGSAPCFCPKAKILLRDNYKQTTPPLKPTGSFKRLLLNLHFSSASLLTGHGFTAARNVFSPLWQLMNSVLFLKEVSKSVLVKNSPRGCWSNLNCPEMLMPIGHCNSALTDILHPVWALKFIDTRQALIFHSITSSNAQTNHFSLFKLYRIPAIKSLQSYLTSSLTTDWAPWLPSSNSSAYPSCCYLDPTNIPTTKKVPYGSKLLKITLLSLAYSHMVGIRC